MSKIIITGATGTAGSEALRQALLHPSISQVIVLSRRPLPPFVDPNPPNPKLKVILHKDFLEYPPTLLDQLKGSDGVLWDLGISSIGFKEKDYEVITVDYALAAAKAFSGLAPTGKKFVFAYLSGQGANQVEKDAGQMFGKVKGRAEKQLAELRATEEGLTTYSFRPAGIAPLPGKSDPNLGARSRFQNWLAPKLSSIIPKYIIDTPTLSHGMIESVLKGSSGTIPGWEGKGEVGNQGTFENAEIKKLAQESELAGK